jgi:hypothetical protein
LNFRNNREPTPRTFVQTYKANETVTTLPLHTFFSKLPPYTLAGFDLRTHSSNLLHGRRRPYHYLDHAGLCVPTHLLGEKIVYFGQLVNYFLFSFQTRLFRMVGKRKCNLEPYLLVGVFAKTFHRMTNGS